MSNETKPDEATKKQLDALRLGKEIADAEKAKFDAEKARLEAQKAALDIQKSIDDAKAPVDPRAKERQVRVEDAKAAKELAEARKAQADASKAQTDATKAQADAELEALKARFKVPDSPYKGDITLKDGAGKTEATLLVAEAVRQIAAAMGERDSMKNKRDVLLVAAADIPTFKNLVAFRAQSAIVEWAFTNADEVSKKAATAEIPPIGVAKEEKGLEAVAPLAAAGLSLEAVDKLLGFFRTDYTVGGIDVTTDDAMLVNELAGVLGAKGWRVTLPKAYNPAVFETSSSKLIEILTSLSLLKIGGLTRAASHTSMAATLTAAADKEVDASKKQDLQRIAQLHTAAADAFKKAGELLDGWFGRLSAPEAATGMVPLAQMLEEEAIQEQLTGGKSLLFVKMHGAGGTFFTARNIATLFGRMTFYHAGGAVGSFVLLDGATGAVVDAAAIPIHGGFVRAVDLPSKFRRSPERRSP